MSQLVFLIALPIEISAMIFIILGSLPFIAYIKFLSGDRKIFLSLMFKLKSFHKDYYLLAIIVLTLFIYFFTTMTRPSSILRSIFFNVISILTGTGYVNAQFDRWR